MPAIPRSQGKGRYSTRFCISSGSRILAINSKSRTAWPMEIPSWCASHDARESRACLQTPMRDRQQILVLAEKHAAK